MSAKALEAFGLGLVAATGIEQPERVCDAIEALYAAVGTRPQKITWAAPKVVTRAYKATTLRRVVGDPKATSFRSWSERTSTCPGVDVHLRDKAGVEEYERRWSGAVAPGMADPAPLLELAAALSCCIVIVSGGLARYPDRWYAEQECWGGGVKNDVDEGTYARLYEDEMLRRRSRTKLRRLYPVTIIGPDLWAALPPMPALDPMPRVEDLGNCKLLTAWPTLCGPRDPAFLRGTRELRAWLWPYTIQNPADHVDNDPKD